MVAKKCSKNLIFARLICNILLTFPIKDTVNSQI